MKKYLILFAAVTVVLALVLILAGGSSAQWPVIDLLARDEAVDAVSDKIDALPSPITEADGPALEAAEAAYEALTEEQRTKVKNYTALQTARTAYDALTDEEKALCTGLPALEAAEKQLEEDKAAATAVYKEGQTVRFLGGSVYDAANATTPSAVKGESICTVTYRLEGKLHGYHIVSTDGKGVYGWVDAVNIRPVD